MPVYVVQSDREAERLVRGLRRRAAIAVGILLGIGVGSTFMLVALGGHAEQPLGTRMLLAFWDTVNLVSTVGSLAEDFTVGQRLWAALVIIFGLGAVLYAFGTVQALVHGGEVRRQIGRKRMKRVLDERSGHVVVCGYGGVGRAVARHLRRGGEDPVIVERDPEHAALADADGLAVVQGDATSERTLADAGIARARGLVASLDSDAENVYLILMARELAEGLRIVARAGHDEARGTLLRAGANRVIVPGETAGLQLSHLVLKPLMSEFIAAAVGEGEYDFAELPVREDSGLVGRTLGELDLPTTRGMLVISLVRPDGTQEFNPPAERTLAGDDVLLVVTREARVAG